MDLVVTPAQKYLWLDIETTGLDPLRDSILDVAGGVEDAIEADTSTDVGVVSCPISRSVTCDPFVQIMHTTNGLWSACNDAFLGIREVEAEILESLGEDASGVILCGSSVYFDQSFIRVHMARLAARLSHRIFDVSSLLLLCKSRGFEYESAMSEHRAGSDLRASQQLTREMIKWLGK